MQPVIYDTIARVAEKHKNEKTAKQSKIDSAEPDDNRVAANLALDWAHREAGGCLCAALAVVCNSRGLLLQK
jgi:hypothetical protein